MSKVWSHRCIIGVGPSSAPQQTKHTYVDWKTQPCCSLIFIHVGGDTHHIYIYSKTNSTLSFSHSIFVYTFTSAGLYTRRKLATTRWRWNYIIGNDAHPYSVEGVNFIVCDAAYIPWAESAELRRKSRAAQLVSFVRAGQKFRRHEHEFSIKAPAHSQYTGRAFHMQIYGSETQAKLKPPHEPLCLFWKESRYAFHPRACAPRVRAVNVYFIFYTWRERWDMNFSLSARAHAAFRMPNNIYTCCAPHLRLPRIWGAFSKRVERRPSQDDMRPIHTKRMHLFFLLFSAEISHRSRSTADSERELRMYTVFCGKQRVVLLPFAGVFCRR